MRYQSACLTTFSNFRVLDRFDKIWYWEVYTNEWFISVKCSSYCMWSLNKIVLDISKESFLVKNITSNVGYIRVCNFYLNIRY